MRRAGEKSRTLRASPAGLLEGVRNDVDVATWQSGPRATATSTGCRGLRRQWSPRERGFPPSSPRMMPGRAMASPRSIATPEPLPLRTCRSGHGEESSQTTQVCRNTIGITIRDCWWAVSSALAMMRASRPFPSANGWVSVITNMRKRALRNPSAPSLPWPVPGAEFPRQAHGRRTGTCPARLFWSLIFLVASLGDRGGSTRAAPPSSRSIGRGRPTTLLYRRGRQRTHKYRGCRGRQPDVYSGPVGD